MVETRTAPAGEMTIRSNASAIEPYSNSGLEILETEEDGEWGFLGMHDNDVYYPDGKTKAWDGNLYLVDGQYTITVPGWDKDQGYEAQFTLDGFGCSIYWRAYKIKDTPFGKYDIMCITRWSSGTGCDPEVVFCRHEDLASFMLAMLKLWHHVMIVDGRSWFDPPSTEYINP